MIKHPLTNRLCAEILLYRIHLCRIRYQTFTADTYWASMEYESLSLSLSLYPLLIEMTVGVFAVTLIDFFFFYKYLCATNVCYVQKEDYLNVVFLEALASSFCLSSVFSLSMGWNDLSHFFTSVGLQVSFYKDLNILIANSFDSEL